MKYLFFYENYDIFKTEQLCANLYRLMEMIFIARKLNRILVLSNFYFTPRDNELINKTNELHIDRIEFIDIRNIINIEELKKICKCISVTEYFKLNQKNTILITKCSDIHPINNNLFFTIYGIIKYNNQININYSSLNILNQLNKYNDIENIIIHNYNRMGNPIWYKMYKEEYYLIRNSIKFSDYYNNKAKNILFDNENTLMVHWRRGDFKLNLGDEKETVLYYKKYNELNKLDNLIKNIILRCLENKISNVYIITNENDDNELNKLSLILKEFNIRLITNKSNCENNQLQYLTNDICEIINGSKCKFQLHGYGNFDRMSQYGRWIIEENMKNKIYFVE
jgi:hypothetical protein